MGNEAIENYSSLDWSCKYPVESGHPSSWDDLEEVYRFAFSKMQIDPSSHPVLATDSAYAPKGDREKLTELLFETFQVPLFYICIQPGLSLFASGEATGTVLHLGGDLATTTVMYEGYPHANGRLDIAGNDLSAFMATLCKGDDSYRMYRQYCTGIKENF